MSSTVTVSNNTPIVSILVLGLMLRSSGFGFELENAEPMSRLKWRTFHPWLYLTNNKFSQCTAILHLISLPKITLTLPGRFSLIAAILVSTEVFSISLRV
jgi:hypothetical protein